MNERFTRAIFLLSFLLNWAPLLHAQNTQTTCLGFENIPAPTYFNANYNYGDGDVILDEQGITASLGQFLYSNGNLTPPQDVIIQNDYNTLNPPFTLGQGNAMWISNATVLFEFPAGVNSVCFSFWAGGGVENISVNGQPLQVVNFPFNIPNNLAPGVTFTITPANPAGTVVSSGTLCLSGSIQSLRIGGQEFFMDNLCYTTSFGPCSLLDLQVTALPCTPNGIFFASVNPGVPANSVTSGYRLFVNGSLQGTYTYVQGAVNVGPFPGDGATSHTFVIEDLLNLACRDTVVLAPVQCGLNCGIANLEVEVLDCTPEGYTLYVNFQPTTIAFPTAFTVWVAGENYGIFTADQLPLTLENVQVPTDALTFEVQVCLVLTTPVQCCASIEVDMPNCPPANPCITFDHFETFAFGASQGNQPGELIYTENNVPLRLLPFQDLDWITSFEELRVEQAPGSPPFAASSGHYLLLRRIGLSFNFSQYPEPVDSVTVDFFNQGQVNIAANGGPMLILPSLIPGIYNLGQGVTLRVILASNTAQQGVMSFSGNIFSLRIGGSFLRLDNMCIIPEAPPCEISELRVEPLPCTTATGQFFVRLDFDHESTSDTFALYVNNNLPVFYAYSEIPLLVGPFQSPSPGILFRVADAETPSCGASVTMPAYTCTPSCSLSNPRYDDIICNNTLTYNVVINFDHSGGVSDSFRVSTPLGFVGIFAYADLPVQLTGVYVLDNRFQICDVANPNCCILLEVGDVPCPGCYIGNFEVEALPCQDDGNFFARLNFSHDLTSGSFQLSINGQFYGEYLYSNLPLTVGPFPGDGQTVLYFTVEDAQFFGCIAGAPLAPVQCSPPNCPISNLQAYIIQCSNTAPGYLYVNFNAISPSADGQFNLYFNNILFGTYDLNTLPLMLPWPFLAPSTALTLQVRVCLEYNPDCCITTTLQRINCNDAECIELEDLETGFIYTAETGYEPGDLLFSEAGVPVTMRQYIGPILPILPPRVRVSTDYFGPTFQGASGQYIVLENSAVEFDFGALNQQVASVCFDFFDGGGIENFSVNGQPVRFVQSLFQLHGQQVAPGVFLHILPTPVNVPAGRACLTGPVHLLLIGGARFGIDNVCFSTLPVECNISELTATATPCVQGQFFVELNFEHQHTGSQGFTVRGNGIQYGTFSYADLPITLGPFPMSSSNTAMYEFEVRDVQHPGCFTSVGLTPPPCNPIIVWPGDTDNDNIARHFDLLNIGLAFGAQGPPRNNTSNAWNGVPASAWNQMFATGDLNYAYADSDGNGVINAADAEIINQNYGLTHGPVAPYVPLPSTPNNPPLFVDMPGGSIPPGAVISAPIRLGSANLPVQEIYGLAFRIEFDPEVFAPNSVGVELPNVSWLGGQSPSTGSNLLYIDRTYAEDGIIEVAITRTNHLNASGQGTIARFRGIIDDIAGLMGSEIRINEIKAIRADETPLAIFNPVETFSISDGVIDVGWLDMLVSLQVYPNPTSGDVFLENRYGAPIDEVRVFNDKGMLVAPAVANSNVVSLGALPSGMYILRIRIGEHVFHKRVVVATTTVRR